jgi:transcription factor MYB, plant
MRKQKALGERPQCKDDDKSMTMASPSSSSVTTAFFSGAGSPNTSSSTVTESAMQQESGGGDDEAEIDEASTAMDQLWNEIAAAEAAASYNMDWWGIGSHASAAPSESPLWEFCSDYPLWRIDDEEYYKKTMLDAS